MAKRIQRKRTKGWKAPHGAVYVGRPTKWGNPYSVGDPYVLGNVYNVQMAVDLFRIHANTAMRRADIKALRGKDLMCWCPLDQPCHADVLLELANASQDGAA